MAFKPGNIPWNAGTADFWGKVEKTDECWLWRAALKKPENYGFFTIDGKLQYAHRYAWQSERGPIPQGLLVCHTCDNPTCVRVSHLFLGTHKDNVDDCVRKGRRTILRGEDHYQQKMNKAQVLEIRRRVAAGEVQRRLAKEFGIHQVTVSEIVRRKIWKHI